MDDSHPTRGPDEPQRGVGHCVFRKDGEYWTIVYEGQEIRLKDAKGLHCLAHLLRNPGREFHATDLVGIGEAGAGEEKTSGPDTATASDLGDAGEPLDARAKAEYRRRLEDLREELAEAERFNDTGRGAAAREEIEAITRQLAAGVGLGGRDRPAASHAERARVAVTQRLKSVMTKLRDSHPSLGRHLGASIKTGYFCSYNPDPAERISWDESRELAHAEVGTPASAPIAASPLASPIKSPGRRLSAILSADVEGYTRLMNEDESGTIRTLTAYRERMAALIAGRHGRVVDSPGDNVLAEFVSAIDAVECAVAVQSELSAENAPLPPERRMEFRIGINVGDVVVEGDRIYGDGVNVAARVEQLAEAGGICISGSVYDQVRNKLALFYDDLGEQALKNIREPVRVYRVTVGVSRGPVRRAGPVSGAKKFGRLALATVTVLLLFLTSNTVRTWWSASAKSLLPLPDRPSIVILPFANLSGDPEQDYFSNGMTEDLIADASKLSGLFVIAHDSVLPYRATKISVQEVGRDLGVRYVLEGSVRKAGDELRVTTRLAEAGSGHQLWAERYDRSVKDTFAVQDDILRHVIADLRVEVIEAELERIRRVPTENLSAYEAYLRGVGMFLHRMSRESVVQARDLLQRAIELDPNFASAYAELGLFTITGLMWGDGVPEPHPDRRIRELVERALALDDSLAIGHIVMAFLRPEREKALAEADRAMALGPNNASIIAFAAGIYADWGKPREAITLLEKAMRRNPRYPGWYLSTLARAYALTDRYEEAIAAHKKVLVSHPDFLPSHVELASIYRRLGRSEEARTEEAEVHRINPAILPDVEEIVESGPPTS